MVDCYWLLWWAKKLFKLLIQIKTDNNLTPIIYCENVGSSMIFYYFILKHKKLTSQ